MDRRKGELIMSYKRKIKEDVFQIIGEAHLKKNEKMQDVVCQKETKVMKAWGLTDGQGENSVIGGEKVLSEIFEYIFNMGIAKLRDRKFQDEIRYEIMRLVRMKIEQLSEEYSAKPSSFSSTIIIFCVDFELDKYMIIQLGDGCVIAKDSLNKLHMISKPDNGVTNNYTWLTTSEEAVSHLRIQYGDLDDKEKIFIMSDGMDCICYGKNILNVGKELLKNGMTEDIFKYAKESKPQDDATCIILSFLEK